MLINDLIDYVNFLCFKNKSLCFHACMFYLLRLCKDILRFSEKQVFSLQIIVLFLQSDSFSNDLYTYLM